MDITLTHYAFESDNQNILLFNNATQRDSYFAGISDKKTIQNINFFANDIMQTKVYVRVDDLSLFNLLNYNYAIITNSENENTQKPLFFHIKNSRQDSGGQIEISLECDIANTYFYDMDWTKIQAIMERAHLDRVIQPNPLNDVYVYAYGENSKLYERERVKNVAKRVVQRQPIYFEIDKTYNSPFNQWLRDNISCWKYYYLASNVSYSKMFYFQFYNNNVSIEDIGNYAPMHYVTEPNERLENEDFVPTNTNSNFIVLCCPVYKNSNRESPDKNIIQIRQQIDYNDDTQYVDYEFDENGIKTFLGKNNQYANVLSIKYSILPPFNPNLDLTNNTDYIIDSNNNLIITYGRTLTQRKIQGYDTTKIYYSNPNNNPSINDPTDLYAMSPLFYIDNQYLYESYKMKCDLNTTSTGIKWVFNKSVLQANYYEPKLWNEDYSTYRLIIGGQTFDMPISKTSNEPHFIYSEILSPDITKAQLSYDVENSNLVSENYYPQVLKNHSMRDFTGFSITIDLSMWFPQDALQDYLASNKNYLQIFNNQQAQKFLSGTISSIGSTIGGAVSENYTGLSQGLGIPTSASKNIVDLFYNRENLNLTIDNMANKPETMSNINSNAMLVTAVQKEISIFIEVLEMLPFEKQTMIDYFKQFGYTYNRLGAISDVLRTRKYYNYVQANIFEIDEKLGNNVKEKIKQMFANGIRFWHYDNFAGVDFTLNNYERFIDNE